MEPFFYNDTNDNGTEPIYDNSFDVIVDVIALSITGVFVAVTIALSFYLMYKHLTNYTRPASQRCIVRIVFMVPLYSIYSYLGLFFYEFQGYFALFRDCYEAYALYMFFALCIEYARGWNNMAIAFDQQEQRRCLEPLCFVKFKPSESLLRWCQRGILQYALIRPLITFVSAILLWAGYYEEGDWRLDRGYVYATVINNVCVSISLYFLVLFYQLGKGELKPYKPLIKFGVIKGIVFFCYWQSVVIMALTALGWLPTFRDWGSPRTAVTLQNLLICVEMLVFSVLHLWAFPYDIYQVKALSQAPFVHEFELNRGMKGIKRGVRDTINQKDMVKDTIDSFVPKSKLKKSSKKHKKLKDVTSDSHIQSLDETSSSSSSSGSVEEVELDIADDSDNIKKNPRR